MGRRIGFTDLPSPGDRSAGAIGTGNADDIFDTFSEKPSDGENTMSINYEIT